MIRTLNEVWSKHLWGSLRWGSAVLVVTAVLYMRGYYDQADENAALKAQVRQQQAQIATLTHALDSAIRSPQQAVTIPQNGAESPVYVFHQLPGGTAK